MVRRLQLGVSRLEDLDVRVLEKFLDKSWLHLGDSESEERRRGPGHYAKEFRRHPLRFLRLAIRELLGRSARPQRSTRSKEDLYSATSFEEFYYRKGDRLRFEDETFDYIFSEHFIHHLFLDEAFALFKECHRILKPYGVLRTVVPDADLRTYSPPEPVGFPDPSRPFTDPLKHKTRWSVYMLAEALRLAGFEAVPLHYCDRHGEYIQENPAQMQQTYEKCPERTLVFELDHVLRPDSLIVDGIRRPGQAPVG